LVLDLLDMDQVGVDDVRSALQFQTVSERLRFIDVREDESVCTLNGGKLAFSTERFRDSPDRVVLRRERFEFGFPPIRSMIDERVTKPICVCSVEGVASPKGQAPGTIFCQSLFVAPRPEFELSLSWRI
jgi:hypothetical protein